MQNLIMKRTLLFKNKTKGFFDFLTKRMLFQNQEKKINMMVTPINNKKEISFK